MSLRPCLTPSSMQYSDIYIHHTHTPHPHPHTPHPHTHTHTHNPDTTLTLPYSNPDEPVSKPTLTLPYLSTRYPVPSHCTTPNYHPSLYLPLTTVHHNRYPPATRIQLHHLPCHYPTIPHLLLTILLFTHHIETLTNDRK